MKSIHYGILGFTTALAAFSPEMAAALEKIGVVGLAGTTVTATGEDGAARVLKTGDDVYLNDHVVSDAGGKAQLIFLDRSTLTLNANTDLTLDKYVFDPATAGGTMSVSSVKGAFRFVGGALSKKQPVTIKTPVATIGIRGGIADTNVQPGSGASDAVFVYGEELTMTNVNGETFSTTQVGSGLMLGTPDGTPQPMPAALINQRMQSFGTPSPEAGEGGGSGGNEGGESGAGATGGGSSSNGSGSSSGSASGTTASGGAAPGGTTVQLVNDSGAPVGAPITFADGAGNIAGNTAQTTGTESIKVAIATGNESVLPGVKSIPQVGTALPPSTTPTAPTVTPPAPPSPPIAGEGGTGTGTGTTTGSGSSTGGGTATPPAAVLRGRYFHYDGSPTMVARGNISTDTGTNQTTFSELDRKGSPIFIYDTQSVTGKTELEHPATSMPGANYNYYGLTYLKMDNNNDGDYADTNEMIAGNYFATTNQSFRQYFFSAGGEPIAFYQGTQIFTDNTSLDASRMAEARTRSVAASVLENFDGVSFYSFLPDVSSYPNGGSDYGLLDYRLAGSSPSNVSSGLGWSTTPGEHQRSGAGMMVDWHKGRFLTQNVEFTRNTTGMEPSAFLGAGVVNNNSPYFLDGGAHHFVGEEYNTVSGNSTSEMANGTVRTGHEIYGTDTGRIEALVMDVAAENKAYSVNPGYFYTTASSSQVQLTVMGADLEVGDYVLLTGVSTEINGIPAASLNGQKFRVVSGGGSAVVIDVGVAATVGGSSAMAIMATPQYYGSQAAVIDNTHGLTAADFTGRRSGAEMRGFAGGIVKQYNGTTAFGSYASSTNKDVNQKLEDVKLTPNASTGSIAGSIAVNKMYGTGATSTTGTFGGVNSAYMNDRYYGAEQTGVNVDGNTATGTGFITTATTDKTVSHCTTCQYSHWGVWAGENTAAGNTNTVEMVPYVAGRVADATEFDAYRSSMGNTGSATYSGVAYGSFAKEAGGLNYVQNSQGTMTANIDLANREVDSLALSFSSVHGGNLTIATTTPVDALAATGAAAIATTGDATFSIPPGNMGVTWGGHSGTGTAVANGALFGPQAQEIGGNFAVQYNSASPTANLTGGGVYQGSR